MAMIVEAFLVLRFYRANVLLLCYVGLVAAVQEVFLARKLGIERTGGCRCGRFGGCGG